MEDRVGATEGPREGERRDSPTFVVEEGRESTRMGRGVQRGGGSC